MKPIRIFLLDLERVAVGAVGLGGIGFVCADTDLVERAIVFAGAVVLALLDGAFDRVVCVGAGGVFHEKASFRIHIALIWAMLVLTVLRDLYQNKNRSLMTAVFIVDCKSSEAYSAG